MLTYAQKKYLFAIYRLGNKGGMISSSDISRLVGVTKASTVKMTQRLTDEGYILKEPYGKIVLTRRGCQGRLLTVHKQPDNLRFSPEQGRYR